MRGPQLDVFLRSDQIDTSDLVVRRMEAVERISRLFTIQLEIVAGQPADLGAIVGAEVSVELSDGEPVERFHGMVARGRVVDEGSVPFVMELEVVPLVYMASLVETLDIYLDQSVPEIIDAKLSLIDLAKGADYELRLGDHPRRDFVVQYKETDLDFVSRLAEHLGISFFFEHGEDRSTLVFSDDIAGHRPIAGGGSATHRHRGDAVDVFRIDREIRLVPRVYVCRDYNYRAPALELQAQHQLAEGFGGGVIEYGSHFKTPEEAAYVARVRAEERLADRDVFTGESTCVHFHAGATVTLEDYPAMTEPLLLTEVVHSYAAPTRTGDDTARSGYVNRFRAVPASRTFRPPRRTPKPRIAGVLTGIVETRQGDVRKRAELDDDGRYQVRFLFDTAPQGERKASKRVRQIQPSAGPGYGMHFPLKPGVEVALAFVDGDPDRPLIVGAIPNPITPSPVTRSRPTANRIRTESGVIIEIEDGPGR